MNGFTFKKAQYDLLVMVKEVLDNSDRDLTNLTIESKYHGNVQSICWTETVIAVKNKRKHSRSSEMQIKISLIGEKVVFHLIRNGRNATDDLSMVEMISYLNQYY